MKSTETAHGVVRRIQDTPLLILFSQWGGMSETHIASDSSKQFQILWEMLIQQTQPF